MDNMIVNIENLTYSYSGKGKSVLNDLSFAIKENESVGLIGANGAGKSTILKILVGICEGYNGIVSVDGMPVEKKNYTEIRKKVGYLFQNSDNQLFLPTVREDVEFGPKNYGYSKEEINERCEWALSQVDMLEFIDEPIYHLSGGLKKRAAIASILSLKPRILLLDEPSVALDPKSRRQLIEVLKKIPGTKFIASHDLDMIGALCDKTILLSKGRLIKVGNTEEILRDKELLMENGL